MIIDKEIIGEFWKFVDKKGVDDCWNWIGAGSGNGYGQLSFKGKKYRSNVLSYIVHFRKVPPKGMYVCHECDNGMCVNPKHLWLGTPLQNILDKLRKGRHPSYKGENNPRAILSKEDIISIRNKFSNGMTCKQIGKEYGKHTEYIRNIVKYKVWK